MNQQNIDELLVLKNDPRVQKIGNELAGLYQRYSQPGMITNSQDEIVQISQNGKIMIDVVAEDNAEALLSQLQTMGLNNGSSFGKVVSGSLLT
jgi:hypothetical protein